MKIIPILAMSLALSSCGMKAVEEPVQIDCSDIRQKMIAEQKQKIANKQMPSCDHDDKDYINNPKSCFWKYYEKQQEKWNAENPDPDQQRLDHLEGKTAASKAAPLPSAHEVACRIQIERELSAAQP